MNYVILHFFLKVKQKSQIIKLSFLEHTSMYNPTSYTLVRQCFLMYLPQYKEYCGIYVQASEILVSREYDSFDRHLSRN